MFKRQFIKKISLVYLGRKGAGPTYSIEMTENLILQGCFLQCILSDQIENRKDWDNLKTKYQALSIIYVNTYSNKIEFLMSLLLGFFKYTVFFLGNLQALTGFPKEIPQIVLPIGISFYTFQLLSYVIDVYRGEAVSYTHLTLPTNSRV